MNRKNSLITNTCVNNQQTTWTYNQGVILSGLGLLYNVTQNITLLNIAQNIADAAINYLSYSNGIFKEPCEPKCDGDQLLFKGIFVRHLSYLLPFLIDPIHKQKYEDFLQNNAQTVWINKLCENDGFYGLIWNNESLTNCNSSQNVASSSAVWDLFLSLAMTNKISFSSSSQWTLIGLGNCMDNQNMSMPNFYKRNVNETICRITAEQDQGSIAYDYQFDCQKIGFCRIRTLSNKDKTPPGWFYEYGNAHNVTKTNKVSLTNCYLKKF